MGNYNVNVKNSNQVNFGGLHDLLTGLSAGNPNIGQIRLAQVTGADPTNNSVELYIISDKTSNVRVGYPGFMTNTDGSSGMWFGLKLGDLVLCGIGAGMSYYIINKIGNSNSHAQDLTFTDDDINSFIASSPNANIQDLLPGSFLMKTGNVKLRLDEDTTLFAGSLGYGSINFDISNEAKSSSSTSIVSNQFYNINTGNYSINGIVLRDKRANIDSEDFNDPKFYPDWYKELSSVNFDTSLIQAEKTRDKAKRNPPLIENREVVYEFPEDYYIESDEKESNKQTFNTSVNTKNPLTSRRIRKQDVLSLSLISPNYLFEKISGTIVDINGHILDLNRNVLPIGGQLEDGNNGNENYLKLRQLHRRGLAFHWEQNSRKDNIDLNIENGEGDSYGVNKDKQLKKNRSRFFFDMDKEGQIKFNIPASSETGNISVLSRYENYTTINPNKKDNIVDYDYFQKTEDSSVADILLDQYGVNSNIEMKGNDNLLPKDRITSKPLKVGTAFHDISKTCIYPIETSSDISQFKSGILFGPDFLVTDGDKSQRQILKYTPTNSIVSTEINIDGDKANAGGRSLTATLDGMFVLSVGANTIDRQSAWYDYQGGIVTRIGSDKNGISSATQTDGDVYLQIGGDPGYRNVDGSMSDTDPDPRFANDTKMIKLSSNKTNRFELRVMQGNGQYARILIDNKGIVVASPKTIEFRSDEDLLFYAGGSVRINGEAVYFHKDDVIGTNVPVHRQSRDYESVYEKDASGDGVSVPKPFFGSKQILG